MHDPRQQRALWRVVSKLEADSLEDWRKHHRPDLTTEGFITRCVTSIETTVERRPGGNVSVTVSLLAKQAFMCEVDYFRLQRTGNRTYKILDTA